MIGIVLNGTFYCTSALGKRMIESSRGGTILNVIANYAWTGAPGVVHSASAKAGVLAMTQTLAVEWARHKIRVNAIAPGPVHTEGASSRLFPDPADRGRHPPHDSSATIRDAGRNRERRLVSALRLRALRDGRGLRDRRRPVAERRRLLGPHQANVIPSVARDLGGGRCATADLRTGRPHGIPRYARA